MNIDNEKLFEALDCLAYVNRTGCYAQLPTDQADEKPFLLRQIKEQLDTLISEYANDKDNAERVEYFGLARQGKK
tara:strand:+ start:1301 stop:1525 length:225 start_codon:yes stop_codon:yes gene_type:complete